LHISQKSTAFFVKAQMIGRSGKSSLLIRQGGLYSCYETSFMDQRSTYKIIARFIAIVAIIVVVIIIPAGQGGGWY